MFFTRCRKLTTFIDPFSLSEHFNTCKSVSSLLNTWQLHSKVFNNKLHGPPFIRTLRNFTPVEIPQAIADFRFKSFLQQLVSDDSADSFFTVCAELGILHKKIGSKVDPLIIYKFEEHIKSFSNWPLELQCKAYNVLTLLYDVNEQTINTGNLMIEDIVKSLKIENPNKSDMLKLMVPCRVLAVENKELFYILEPFLLRDSNQMLAKELVQVFSTYGHCKVGSKDFIQQFMLNITINSNKMTALELGIVLKYSCQSFSQKIFNFQDTMIVLVQEMLKKIQKFTENEFKTVFDTLFYIREGNVHYYELLAIVFVRNGKNLSDQELIDVAYTMGQVGVKSEASSKILVSAVKPMVLAQASTIQGHLTIEKISPIGLISSLEREEFELDQAKHFLFPDLKKIASKAVPLSVESVYETTKHPLYNFQELVKLLWGYLVLGENSNIETIDGTTLNLMIKLLNRQLEELNKNFKEISNLQYDMLVQIKKIIKTHFTSLKNVQIPKGLTDYTLHLEHQHSNFLNETEKQEDEIFVEKLKNFCDERFIKVNLPGNKGGKMMKEFYVDEYVVNVPGKSPGIIIRNCDMMRNGVINEVLKRKLKSLKNVRVISAAEWGEFKSDEYFSQLLDP